MPAGKPWCTEAPDFRLAPPDPLWRVHPAAYASLAANPRSEARGALVGTHAMFYAADSLSGALWEAALRYVEVDLPLLELGRPGILALFPYGDGPEVLAVNALRAAPRHQETHPECRQLQQDLQAVGVADMPVLSWPSRQFPECTVYLAYAPPMGATWWEVLDPPIALNDAAGLALIRAELESHGFDFEPLDTIPPGDA